jgi:hypothetical protein
MTHSPTANNETKVINDHMCRLMTASCILQLLCSRRHKNNQHAKTPFLSMAIIQLNSFKQKTRVIGVRTLETNHFCEVLLKLPQFSDFRRVI